MQQTTCTTLNVPVISNNVVHVPYHCSAALYTHTGSSPCGSNMRSTAIIILLLQRNKSNTAFGRTLLLQLLLWFGISSTLMIQSSSSYIALPVSNTYVIRYPYILYTSIARYRRKQQPQQQQRLPPTIRTKCLKCAASDDNNLDHQPQPPLSPQSAKVPESAIILTSDILSLRFRDVFAHFRNQQLVQGGNEQTQYVTESTIRTNLLRTRHINLELNKCYINTSTIENAGYGVFAKQHIQQNELITLYPGDALILWKNQYHIDHRTSDGIQILFGTHIPDTERIVQLTPQSLQQSSDNTTNSENHSNRFMSHIPSARNYEVRISDTISLIGDPNRYSDPAYLGHMINDYCTITDKSTNTTSEQYELYNIDETSIRRYNIQSIQESNCKIQVGIDQCHVEIIATRNINVGEELFLSYGSNYWLTRMNNSMDTNNTIMQQILKPETSTKPMILASSSINGFATKTAQIKNTKNKPKKRR